MRDSFNEINITPLTDIFLVLLIIMMVIAPMLDQQGLQLAVPEVVNESQILKDTKIMNINVEADNRILWNDNELQSAGLEEFFSKHSKEFSDGLLIQADENSEHGTIVRIMDSARNSGFTSISLSRG
ncbi:MAG: biopolymer transporter ExbD [bacterium]|nr:biopolymer transporter ExbD [bacterium]